MPMYNITLKLNFYYNYIIVFFIDFLQIKRNHTLTHKYTNVYTYVCIRVRRKEFIQI